MDKLDGNLKTPITGTICMKLLNHILSSSSDNNLRAADHSNKKY